MRCTEEREAEAEADDSEGVDPDQTRWEPTEYQSPAEWPDWTDIPIPFTPTRSSGDQDLSELLFPTRLVRRVTLVHDPIHLTTGAPSRSRTMSPPPDETPFAIEELPSRLASSGMARRGPATCIRWATRGHRGVVLATTRKGRHLYTDMARVRAFLERADLR